MKKRLSSTQGMRVAHCLLVDDKPVSDTQFPDFLQPGLRTGTLAEGPCLYPMAILSVHLDFYDRSLDPVLFQVTLSDLTFSNF